jgi:transposase
VLFLGDDWAEAHDDIELQDESGRILARRRFPEGLTGLTQLHALVADHLGDDDEPGSVLVGIETDRGPWVQALVATGYTVYPINPLQVSRYRERHATSGRRATRARRTCSPRSCAPTALITALPQATASGLRWSRPWPAPIRR